VVVRSQLVKRDEKWVVAYSAAVAEGVTPSDEIKKEVQALQRLSAWAFVIPESKALAMTKPNEDVLVKAGK
jgi:predicted GH43/DUF377 family glycosyl hydrolase